MGAKTFEDLIVWQKADELSTQIDQLTETFPAKELYRLVDQMRAAPN